MKRDTELIVTVTLDPIPGAFHTAESAREIVQWILKERIGHYSPRVEIAGDWQPGCRCGASFDEACRCGTPCDEGCECE